MLLLYQVDKGNFLRGMPSVYGLSKPEVPKVWKVDHRVNNLTSQKPFVKKSPKAKEEDEGDNVQYLYVLLVMLLYNFLLFCMLYFIKLTYYLLSKNIFMYISRILSLLLLKNRSIVDTKTSNISKMYSMDLKLL